MMKVMSVLAILIVCEHTGNALRFNGVTSQTQSQSLIEDYLTKLFDATIGEVISLANNFTFKTVSPDAIEFLLYEPGSDEPTPLDRDSPVLPEPKEKIIFITHGWQDFGRNFWVKEMAQAYYKVFSNVTVIAVNWHRISRSPSYLYAASAVQSVGYYTAEFVWKLIKRVPSRLDNVHLVGHSLGAQSCGFSGQRLEKLSGRKVDRITGLEPAGPLFTSPFTAPASLRLTRTDATFVDVYHTNIYMAGQANPAGQIDVYWNCGGPFQPNCFGELIGLDLCSHLDSYLYFIETIKDAEIYPAGVCSKLSDSKEMISAGERVTRNAEGMFCASTVRQTAEKCVIFYGLFNL